CLVRLSRRYESRIRGSLLSGRRLVGRQARLCRVGRCSDLARLPERTVFRRGYSGIRFAAALERPYRRARSQQQEDGQRQAPAHRFALAAPPFVVRRSLAALLLRRTVCLMGCAVLLVGGSVPSPGGKVLGLSRALFLMGRVPMQRSDRRGKRR